MSPGERRRREGKRAKKAAIYAQRVSVIREAGGKCDNCKHILRNPSTLKGTYCDLESDFHGYSTTKPESVCPDWQRN